MRPTNANSDKGVWLVIGAGDATGGAIDTAFIRELFPERYALKAQDGILNPDHIADAYRMLHTQPRDAWTHEFDLRLYMEKF